MFTELEFGHWVNFHSIDDLFLIFKKISRFHYLKAASLNQVDTVRLVTGGENCLPTVEMHQFEMVKQVFKLMLRQLLQGAELFQKLDPALQVTLYGFLHNAGVGLAI